MQIKQVMTPPTTAVSEIAHRMHDGDSGAAPVVDNERLTGVVTDRDIVKRVVAAERGSESAMARDGLDRTSPTKNCEGWGKPRHAA
jgi:CBS domain-containing protein